MDEAKVKEAAQRLAAAWVSAGAIDGMRDELRPQSRAEAYAIQDEMVRIIGLPIGGWKLGATSPAVRRQEGHDGPMEGRVFASMIFANPAALPPGRFPEARVEAEFAFEMLADAPARPEPYGAAELIGQVVLRPSVEIIGNRYPKGAAKPRLTTFDEIADNATGIGLVVGEAVQGWRGLDLQNQLVTMRVDGGEASPNVLGEDRCVAFEILVECADMLSRRGLGLKRGDIVSTGSVNVPLAVYPGAVVTVDYGPVGRIEMRFA